MTKWTKKRLKLLNKWLTHVRELSFLTIKEAQRATEPAESHLTTPKRHGQNKRMIDCRSWWTHLEANRGTLSVKWCKNPRSSVIRVGWSWTTYISKCQRKVPGQRKKTKSLVIESKSWAYVIGFWYLRVFQDVSESSAESAGTSVWILASANVSGPWKKIWKSLGYTISLATSGPRYRKNFAGELTIK